MRSCGGSLVQTQIQSRAFEVVTTKSRQHLMFRQKRENCDEINSTLSPRETEMQSEGEAQQMPKVLSHKVDESRKRNEFAPLLPDTYPCGILLYRGLIPCSHRPCPRLTDGQLAARSWQLVTQYIIPAPKLHSRACYIHH